MTNHEKPSRPTYHVLHDYESMKGTSRHGYLVSTPYDYLVSLFGEPLQGDGDKTDANWIIETNSGIATIYNYKDGKNWLGEAGKDTQDIATWHVGTKDEEGFQAIAETIVRGN